MGATERAAAKSSRFHRVVWQPDPVSDVDDRAEAQQRAVDEFLALLRYERRGESWVGRTPDWYGPVVFGGIGIAMTIGAACLDAPAGARLHSIHAQFLRPVQGGRDIDFDHDVLKAGRAFTTHVVSASHDEARVRGRM